MEGRHGHDFSSYSVVPLPHKTSPPPRFTSPENIDDNVETNTEDNINSRPNPRAEPSSQRSMSPVPV